MKKRILLFSSGFAIMASSLFISVNTQKGYYSPKANYLTNKQNASMKGLEWIYSMKANQKTGVVNIADVMAAKNQLNNMRLNKAGFPLIWEEAGPDNIGGRCRTMLVDRNNPSILYAAGVSGGIFRSANAGASWSVINDALPTLAFQSSCQTVDGTIYFGSGENSGVFGGSIDRENSGHSPGEGIFKSTDGVTFTQLPSTVSFSLVNSMASSPTGNIAFAGTNTNLKCTEDGGTTWKNVFNGSCREVKVATNGTVIAYMGSKIYRSTTGNVSGSYVAAEGIIGSFNRLGIAISPQDPNYVYVLASTASTNSFGGLFQSTDGGVNFTKIVPGGSSIFDPMNPGGNAQGDYDLVVAVHPRNKKRVFMGGVVMAEWTETQGPFEVANGTHSDHHCFTFDTVSNPMRMYAGNDGGVYRSTSGKFDFFAAYNIGFNVTQFYAVAASSDGSIIGGTQDNGTLHISKIGTEKKRAEGIWSGDGFRCEISKVNQMAFLVESQYGNIGRSVSKGGSFGNILDKRVPRYKLVGGKIESDPKGTHLASPFNTALRLCEAQDTISRLFVGADDCVWMVEHVLTGARNPIWFKVSELNNTFIIETSINGKHAFVGKPGDLERITIPLDNNGNLSYFDTMLNLDPKLVYPGCISKSIYGNLPAGRFITGISVDQSNPNRMMVTLGNYGNSNYIYITENALDDVLPVSWKSVQGNLPAMPVYDAEFVYDNPNMVVIGTEFGIFGTTNVMAGSVSWVEQNTGKSAKTPFPRVAVYDLRQVENMPGDIGSILVAGTHGRGIFETRTLYTGIKNTDGSTAVNLNIFPNPVTEYANVQFTMTRKDNISIRVMDMTGKIILEKQMNNETPGFKKIRIETGNLATGTYIINVTGNNQRGAAKMIVQ